MRVEPPVLKVDDFVWAKVTGYSYWPAIIMEPDPLVPPKPHGKDTHWVYFFGSHNYAWIPLKYIKPFNEFKKKYKNKCSKSIRTAYEELRWNQKQIAKNPYFKIDFVKFIVKERRSRSRSIRSSASSYGSRRASSSSTKRSRSPLSEYPNENNTDSDDESSDDVQSLSNEEIMPTTEPVGVFANSLYSRAFIKNLIFSGHNLLVWSPLEGLCAEMKQFSIERGTYFKEFKCLRELTKRAAIIFTCFHSVDEAKAVLYELGADDRHDHVLRGKIYVEMTVNDYRTSYAIQHCLNKKHACYMEAMIQGTPKTAEEREIMVLVGGQRDILNRYKSCFSAMGKVTCLVGEIGSATKFHMILQAMKSLFLTGFAEALALAEHYIDPKVFMQIFEASPLYCLYFQRVCDTIRGKDYFDIQETVQSLQQNLDVFLAISEQMRQPAPMAAIANQLFKHARRIGFDDRDSSAMYLRAR